MEIMQYSLYVVSGDTIIGDDWTFDTIIDNSIDSFHGDKIGELLTTLIRGLNGDTVSDQN